MSSYLVRSGEQRVVGARVSVNGEPSRLNCEILRDFSALEELASEWQRLWAADPCGEMFQNFSWVRAWWEGYGRRFRVFSPVVWEGNTVIGVLPLALIGRELQFLGGTRADYNDVICEDARTADVLASAFAALLEHSRLWNWCSLTNIAPESRIARHLHELPLPIRKRLKPAKGQSCPTIVLHQNRSAIFEKILKRRNDRYHQKRLEKLGALSFRHLTSRREALQHLPRFLEQQSHRRALSGKSSNSPSPEYRRYCEALLKHLDPATTLRLGVLEVDGACAAYTLGFQTPRKFLMYQQSFDVNLWNCAPGAVSLRQLLLYAQGTDTVEYDFGAGNEQYKHHFANHVRQLTNLYLVPQSVRGAVNQLRCAGFEALKNQAARSRFLFRIKQVVKEAYGRSEQIIQAEGISNWLTHLWRSTAGKVFSVNRVHFHIVDSTGVDARRDFPRELRLSTASRSDLAALAVQYPAFFSPGRLRECHERWKRGEELVAVRVDANIAVIGWAGTGKEFGGAEAGATEQVSLARPVRFVHDCWVAPKYRGLGLVRAMALTLAADAAQGMQTCIRCEAGNGYSCPEVDSGYSPQNRVGLVSFLRPPVLQR